MGRVSLGNGTRLTGAPKLTLLVRRDRSAGKSTMPAPAEVTRPPLRRRATAIVIRNGRVLLARNRGQDHYSLPGGGIRIGESIRDAVARELRTELRLHAAEITRLPMADHDGSGNRHHVCLVEARGEPVRRRIELSDHMWWDMKAAVPVLPHVKAILGSLSGVQARN